jgi:hypothetical protein
MSQISPYLDYMKGMVQNYRQRGSGSKLDKLPIFFLHDPSVKGTNILTAPFAKCDNLIIIVYIQENAMPKQNSFIFSDAKILQQRTIITCHNLTLFFALSFFVDVLYKLWRCL